MSTLICGSVAYDSIMVFPGRFKDVILPDQVHILNVAFLVPEMRREFGGCAGNIAYNLRMLGGEALPMATVGDDAQPYLERFDALGISRRFVRSVAGSFTAQAFITTDLDDNQITAFHPGAMSQSHLNAVPGDGSVRLGIVAPDGRDGMLQHAQQFAERGIPFIFDPGQGLPMFGKQDLAWFIERAHYVAVNDYEARLIVDKSGQSLENIARQVGALIVTRAGRPGAAPHRSDRLWRRLSRRPAVRPVEGSRLGNDRSPGGNDGRDQDRERRRAEPHRRPLADRRALPRGLRLPPLVRSRRVSRCGREPATGR
jgi:adenosine kinase